MKPNFVMMGAICTALAVVLGAFAAHGLRGSLGAAELALWETGTRYYAIGSLGILLFGVSRASERSSLPGWLLLAGSTVFAGSLYGLALGAPRALGAVTPFGGLGLIAGFLSFAWAARRT